jgi:ubiquinone/menaquinone biosynthesis C-methylase UbiE
MWEVYAASYDQILPELPFYREVVERHCHAMLAPGISSVLDLGAGTGSVTERLLSAGRTVTAVDRNRAMLGRLQAKCAIADAGRLTVIEDTAESLPCLDDEGFDGVTVLLAFFDMENPVAALTEAIRLLKPGGTLVVTEPRACFNVSQLMAAAEHALRAQGNMDRLSRHWRNIQTVAPLIRDSVVETTDRKAALAQTDDWNAEAIYESLNRVGFVDLTFRESHLGNCATITGTKPRTVKETDRGRQNGVQ